MSVTQANAAMTQIAQLNQKLQSLSAQDPAAATLMDQRDSAIDQLSKLMDIRVVTDGTNQTTVFTTSGIQLVGGVQASTLIVQLAVLADREFAVERRSRRSRASAPSSCQLPNGAKIDMIAIAGDQLRPDRGRRPVARQDAGAGAEPGRSDGGDARQRAVRRHNERHRRSRVRRRASTPICPTCCRATRSTSLIPTATNVSHTSHRGARGRSDRAADSEHGRESERQGDRRQFFRRARLDRVATEHASSAARRI